MTWIFTTFKWYLALLLLGAIFFPLTKKIFGRFFPDLGYAFAKTLAILFLSYAAFVLGILKIVEFSRTNLIFLIFLFVLLNIYLFKKNKDKQSTVNNRQSIFLIIFEELLFLIALFFWAFIRGQEPSIRGLEKFMDFGFINAILRSKYFPPLDMWLSSDQSNPNGYFINYYYFGHLTGAFLIKLTGVKSAVGYNLILATIFALSVTQTFSFITGIISSFYSQVKEKIRSSLHFGKLIFFGLLGSFIVNLGGNLHTIYVFTKGYPNESPIPFWKILSWYNPTRYWYPNATRFIPDTIHEFPSYSWVVADLHGHVFDIPFILLTLAILFLFVVKHVKDKHNPNFGETKSETESDSVNKLKAKNYNSSLKNKIIILPGMSISLSFNSSILPITDYRLPTTVFLGFLTAVHYMTNAFDGPIYILLTIIVLFFLYRLTKAWFIHIGVLIVSFVLFSFPFSLHFKPFVTGIGVNCSPEFLVNVKKLGPFLFEKGNCQVSPTWMLFVLWGFFWINLIIFLIILRHSGKRLNEMRERIQNRFWTSQNDSKTQVIDTFIFILFLFGTFLIIIPEFFYIKDIYPTHFRANTMFKMGYQAFIMMGIASTYTFFKIKQLDKTKSRLFAFIFVFFFFFIAIYPLYSIPSYYGQLDRPVQLDGSKWLERYFFDEKEETFSEDKEIIDFINSNIKDQPNILEAQGDSYTDYERISAYTGLPTVAGWWVHEWLWRGSSDVVGNRINDIVNIYESPDIDVTLSLIKKYKVDYVVVSTIEKKKYQKLNEEKFSKIAEKVFKSSNGFGALYKVRF